MTLAYGVVLVIAYGVSEDDDIMRDLVCDSGSVLRFDLSGDMAPLWNYVLFVDLTDDCVSS